MGKGTTEDKKNLLNKVYLVVMAILVIAILWLIVSEIVSHKKEDKAVDNATSSLADDGSLQRDPAVLVKYETKEKLVEVEVEKEITHEIIQDGLNDMGVLVTEEYYFTQVENYTSSKTYFKLITSKSNFVYSYDGVVGAGVDFDKITVEKNDLNKTITISMPKAVIQYTDIDFDSFKVYSEKEGLWNPIKISDYNDSMIEFETNAENKALEKGILDRADKGAETIITNFVLGLMGNSDYKVKYIHN